MKSEEFAAAIALSRSHTVVLPVIIETGSTLPAPDIRLREQHKRAVNGFEQGWESPAVVVALCRLRNAAKRRNGLHLVGRREREESLVGIRPLLHPPAGALGNPVGQKFLRATLIAESHAIVEHTKDQLLPATYTIAVLIGLVLTMATLARYHIITDMKMPGARTLSEAKHRTPPFGRGRGGLPRHAQHLFPFMENLKTGIHLFNLNALVG